MPLRCELHCHSIFSPDCKVSLQQIISICLSKNISIIALTDHNEIRGAQKLKSIAPDWLTVIIGEEVCTNQGDIIGLFLHEKINPDQSLDKTIDLIHGQGGLAILPHPTDRIRREAVGWDNAIKVIGKVDFIEIFNSRCIFSNDNREAYLLAKNNNILGVVGSDAHTVREYGKSIMIVDEHHKLDPHQLDAAIFSTLLSKGTYTVTRSGLNVHLETKIVKELKKLSKAA